jgi:hypothetical protein
MPLAPTPSRAVSAADTAARPDRRIALLKPTGAIDERITHALQLMESIVWAFHGTMHSTWRLTAVDSADVLVFYEGDTDECIDQWKSQGKPVVEIAVQSRLDSDTPNLLVYPFRAAQVLVLLERLETQLTSGLDAPVPVESTTTLASANQDPWSFVEGLRTLRSVQNSEAWLVGRDARTPILWVRGDAATYAAEPATVQAIRHGFLNPNRLTLEKGSAPTGGQAPRSGMELSWFTGYYASGHLAPALSISASYRTSSWPNFGLIRPSPQQMRVAAALAAAAADLSEIIKRAGVTADEAIRTLNALYACGVLVGVSPGEAGTVVSAGARRRATSEPRAGLAKLLANVRKHLGLGGRP